jgi:hypothetical protein
MFRAKNSAGFSILSFERYHRVAGHSIDAKPPIVQAR